MTTMTILSERRGVVANRRGETLIEIMASIMVLCIGLVGVLAAIPFGGFRMSQMAEADNSAAVGRNAVRVMKVNGWGNPNSWLIRNFNNGSFVGNPGSLIYQNNGVDYIDTSVPFVIDYADSRYRDSVLYVTAFTPDGGYDNLSFGHVSPLPSGGYASVSLTALNNWYDHIFYQQDDLISGYYDTEDETEFRPRVETEVKNLLDGNSSTIPAFSGRYSWMAFVYPKSGSSEVECELTNVTSADFDAVVFRDRIAGDERSFSATVEGSGYQGGVVTIDLSSCRDSDNNVANSPADYARVREQLQQTRYILLAGQDDYPKASSGGGFVYPTKACWYKIANFANVTEDTVRLTLIGPNTPANWIRKDGSGNRPTLTAVFYPGVIGVYSGSAAF